MIWDAATLKNCIKNLPLRIEQDAVVKDSWNHIQPVMRAWTYKLPLRHQGVIVTGLRGCDGASKHDLSKPLQCMIRRAVMNPHDERETLKAGGFFGFDPINLGESTLNFLHSLDQYPLHYITHLMHTCQVIGYKCPDPLFRQFFIQVYEMIVYKLHLRPESQQAMDDRLTSDRIALGTTEKDF